MDLKGRDMILSISGGNILTSLGGTEKVIISHQKMFNKAGIAYLYIYPVQKKIKDFKVYYYWGGVFDGIFQGLYSTNEIIEMIGNDRNTECNILKIHVHHLKGIELKELRQILDIFSPVGIYFYSHDYYLICDEYTLKNDKGKYCGIGIPSKDKCNSCRYFRSNENSVQRRAFVNSYSERMILIVPSDFPAEIITQSIPEFKKKILVIYHQKKIGEYDGNRALLSEREKIKIAFCGLQSDVKGWPGWLKAAKYVSTVGANVELYHLGKATETYPFIKNIPVGFQDNSLTMAEALRKYKIDCVVLWSQIPETYSYVYYECISANSFVITYKNSGNIARQVELNFTGVVLNSDTELRELLYDTVRIRTLVNIMRKKVGCGPLKLEENDKIVEVSLGSKVSIKSFPMHERLNMKKIIIERLYIRNLRHKWGVQV